MADLKFLASEWPTISRRLDQALALTAAERDTWLEALQETESVKLKLRDLLNGALSAETSDFLEAPPSLTLRSFGADQTNASVAENDAPKAGTLIGPYRLIAELGVGGMGSVWLAVRADGGLKREVALKLPRCNWSQGLAERMRRERDILASLDHPNIARIYDAGLDAHGRTYLALEYVDGEAIDLYCKRLALSTNERLRLLLQVARAVAHAHARLVVHRDLKPANILVTAEGQVRLLDFGIAKLLEGELTSATQLTQIAGRALTLDYASPEQIRGEPIGTASDVYSLAVVAYELLAEAKPYQLKRQSAAALEEAIASVDVRLASNAAVHATARDALKGDLDAILNQALKKNIVERYAGVDAFAQDIERHLADLPVLARPDALRYRARKFVARNRVAIAATTVIAMALLTTSGVAVWKAIEASTERARAERVKDMIGSIFAEANPYVSGKSEATVRDLLKSGVDRIEKELTSEPAVAAELLSLLSTSYRDLGEVEPALTTALKAHELASKAYPEGHLMRARIQRVLAEANNGKGNIDEARRLLEQAVAVLRGLGDTGAFDLARALIFLASVASNQGRTDDAIALGREAVALMTRVRGVKDAATIGAIGELSNSLMIAGQKDEALVEAERAYRLASTAFADPNHPITVGQMAHYAYALQSNGQHRAAIEKWQAVVAAQKKSFNPRGSQVAATLVGLGRSQEFLGDLKAALQSYEESLAMMQGFGAGVSGELAIRYYSIGRVALMARQADKALRFLTTAIERGSTAFGGQSGRVRDAKNFRAAALVYAGRLSDAETLLDGQIVEDRKELSPSLTNGPGATLRASLRNRALLDRARGDAQGAITKLEEVGAIEGRVTGIGRKATGIALAEIGRAALDANRVDTAIASLTQAIAILREEEAMPTPQQADAWVALGRAHLLKGQVGEALRGLALASEFWQQFDPNNAFSGEAAFWYATALLTHRDHRLAQQQFARAVPLLEASTWPSHRQLALQGTERLLAFR